jgi:hypothetical protein
MTAEANKDLVKRTWQTLLGAGTRMMHSRTSRTT